jgi:hypothetical protein
MAKLATLVRGALLLSTMGLPATGWAQPGPVFPQSGCLVCLHCPPQVGSCAAASFTSLDDLFEQRDRYLQNTCEPAGCADVLQSTPCRREDLEIFETLDPTFDADACLRDVAASIARQAPVLSSFGVVVAVASILGVGALRLLQRQRAN